MKRLLAKWRQRLGLACRALAGEELIPPPLSTFQEIRTTRRRLYRVRIKGLPNTYVDCVEYAHHIPIVSTRAAWHGPDGRSREGLVEGDQLHIVTTYGWLEESR